MKWKHKHILYFAKRGEQPVLEINKAEPSSIHTFPFGPELQFYILGTFLHGTKGPEAPASKIKIGVQSGAPWKGECISNIPHEKMWGGISFTYEGL